MALHRAGQASAQHLRRRLNDRPPDELLNETLFTPLAHVHETLAAWKDDSNTVRPHSAIGFHLAHHIRCRY